MDISNTLKERGERYGAFADHAAIAQRIQDSMRDAPGWQRLAADQKHALTVIADKIARMLNGDPDYIDNWHDIIGYSKLVEARLEADQSGATLADHTHTGKPANDNFKYLKEELSVGGWNELSAVSFLPRERVDYLFSDGHILLDSNSLPNQLDGVLAWRVARKNV